MSRVDGQFPTYKKIDIDPNRWPEAYWNSARTCVVCNTSWPSIDLFITSPCCGSDTHFSDEQTPDMRWPDAVKAFLLSRFEQWYEEWNAGVTDEQLAWESSSQYAELEKIAV